MMDTYTLFVRIICSFTLVSSTWISTNPGGGGAFNSPVITSEGYLVVGSDLSGIYISKNNGEMWYAVGSTNGLDSTHVSSIASHPFNKLFVGTDHGIYIGTSEGTGFVHYTTTGYVSDIVVSVDPQIIYAAIHEDYAFGGAEIIQSSDGGFTWNVVSPLGNFPVDLRILALRAHPNNSSSLCAITGESRAVNTPAECWCTTNNGLDWTRVGSGLGDVMDMQFSMNSQNNVVVYISTFNNIYVSNDEQNWTNYGNVSGIILTNDTDINHIRLINLLKHTVWDNECFSETFDNGMTWNVYQCNTTGGWSEYDKDWGMGSSEQGYTQTLGYRSDSHFILRTNIQFIYGTDDGRKWIHLETDGQGKYISTGIDNVVPVIVEQNQKDSNILYAGYMDLGIWRSDDGGKYWKSLNSVNVSYSGNWQGNGGNTLTILSDPLRTNVVWAQLAGDLDKNATKSDSVYLVKSYNKGQTWMKVMSGLPSANSIYMMESLTMDEESTPSNRILYIIVNGNVYTSKDDGITWNGPLFACGDCNKVYVNANSIVYAMGPSNVWRSQSNGEIGTWNILSLPSNMTLSWTSGLHWLYDPWNYIGPLDIVTVSNDNIFLAIYGDKFGAIVYGLYYSSNYGVSWTHIFKNNYVRSVAFDETTNQILVASSSASCCGDYDSDSEMGVFVSDFNGANFNFEKDTDGLAWELSTFVSVSNNGDRWIISPGQGIMYSHNFPQCHIGKKCDRIEDCCDGDVFNERDIGITCSCLYKGSKYWQDSKNKNDRGCCVKMHNPCRMDDECCNRKGKCHQGICTNQQNIPKSVNYWQDIDTNIMHNMYQSEENGSFKWIVMIISIFISAVIITFYLCYNERKLNRMM